MKLVINNTASLWAFFYNADFNRDDIMPMIYPLYKKYDHLIDPASGEILESIDDMIIEIPLSYWQYDPPAFCESLDDLKDNILGIIIDLNSEEEQIFIDAMIITDSEDIDYWKPRIANWKCLTGYILI